MNTADFVSLMNSYVFNLTRIYTINSSKEHHADHLKELRDAYQKALDKVLNPGANALARSWSKHEDDLEAAVKTFDEQIEKNKSRRRATT